MVLGIVGRRISGARVGLVAAAVAATYPPLWVNDGMLLSESLFLLLVSLVLLATYRYYEAGSFRAGAGAAVLIGLTALVRAEALLMLPLILIPAAVRRTRGQSRRRRIGVPLALAASVGIVISPWVAFNLSRFERPMFLNADGITLASGNCRTTYHGWFLGYYDLRCVPAKPVARRDLVHYLRTTDESVENAEQRTAAFRYVRAHLLQVPGVVIARVGRLWQLNRVEQTRELDILVEGRDRFAVEAGFWYSYFLAPLAVVGAIVLRRRKIVVLPLAMLVAIATLSAATAFGVMRYRAIAEPALVLLGSVAIVWLFEAVSARRQRASP